ELSWRSLTAVGISGGLLPCPSALVVLLAAISLHRVALGLLLIVAFSAGLALSITGIGLVAVFAKRSFRRLELQGRAIGLLPVVLYRAYLPGAVQRGAETAIGFMIAGLAVWLLVRWRRGAFHAHAHEHEDRSHAHLHSHRGARHGHPRSRTPLGAFGIGLVHGVGGSAGV